MFCWKRLNNRDNFFSKNDRNNTFSYCHHTSCKVNMIISAINMRTRKRSWRLNSPYIDFLSHPGAQLCNLFPYFCLRVMTQLPFAGCCLKSLALGLVTSDLTWRCFNVCQGHVVLCSSDVELIIQCMLLTVLWSL